MSTLELPKSSVSVVAVGLLLLLGATVTTISHLGAGAWLLVIGLGASGYISDLFTGIAHFCFDYVFPYRTPVFGPISKEFTDHHEHPTLDPSNYVDNLTKGSYASIPISIAVLGCAPYLSSKLPSKVDQVRAFREMFDPAPIPPLVRRLQRWRLILTPERHNIHHLNFDADFSSVNGWSDPLLNLVVTPLARHYKSIPNRQR